MKVTLENFGPIKRAEFDLTKELNVIFGKNNIGKSYAITALYIVLKHLLVEFGGDNEHYVQFLTRTVTPGLGFAHFVKSKTSLSPLDEFIKAIRDEVHISDEPVVITSPVENLMRQMIDYTLEAKLTESFKNSFESLAQLKSARLDQKPTIRISSSVLSMRFVVLPDKVFLDELSMHKPVEAVKSDNTLIGAGYTVFFMKTTEDSPAELQEHRAQALFLLGAITGGFTSNLFNVAKNVYFLPASRSGLYQGLNNISAVLAELAKSRSSIEKGISLPNLSEPVADYFLQISTINSRLVPGTVAEVASQLENEILGGEVDFDEQTKKLFFRQQDTGYRMDLAFASSMISEVAPIVAYCKYVLRWERPGAGVTSRAMTEKYYAAPNLIFVEEPEAHLHPEIQVKLMESFVRLSKHNVKLVMTSHSNYMFNKLSNLLLTEGVEPETVGSYLMRATSEGSVMDAVAMRAEEEGMMDENFVDVAEQLYNERLAAYDKLNAKQ